jgi:hypothetical protein
MSPKSSGVPTQLPQSKILLSQNKNPPKVPINYPPPATIEIEAKHHKAGQSRPALSFLNQDFAVDKVAFSGLCPCF